MLYIIDTYVLCKWAAGEHKKICLNFFVLFGIFSWFKFSSLTYLAVKLFLAIQNSAKIEVNIFLSILLYTFTATLFTYAFIVHACVSYSISILFLSFLFLPTHLFVATFNAKLSVWLIWFLNFHILYIESYELSSTLLCIRIQCQLEWPDLCMVSIFEVKILYR